MRAQSLLISASFIFMFGVGAIVATLPVVLWQYGSNDVEISLAFTIWGLVYMLSSIPSGILADRLGANRVAPMAFLLNSTVGILMCFSSSTSGFALARALEGFLEALIWASVIGLAAKSESNLFRISDIYVAQALGFSAGSLVAEGLAKVYLRLPFLAYSVCSVVSFLLSLPLSKLKVNTVEKTRLQPFFRMAFLPLAVTAVVIGVTESLVAVYSPFLAQLSGLRESQFVISTYYISGLVGQLSLRLLSHTVMTESYPCVATLVTAAFLASTSGNLLLLGVGILGFINAHLISRSQAKVTETMKNTESTGVGLVNMAWSLGYFAGSPLYSLLLAPYIGPQIAVAIVLLFTFSTQALAVTATKFIHSEADRATGRGVANYEP